MQRRIFSSATALLFALSLFFVTSASAKVSVEIGPTPIPGGDALAQEDITLANDLFAVSIAVGTIPPWGMPKGGIIDAAAKKDGKLDMDRLTLMDFLTDKWAEWSVIDADIKILEQTDKKAVVQMDRVWRDASLVSTYTVLDGDDRVYLKTVMTNNGKEEMKDHYSGYAQWAKAGALKEPAGAEGVRASRKTVAEVKRPGTLHTVAYEEDWALALYAPYVTHANYEGKDMYGLHTLKPGESRSFEGWFQVLPSGDISGALAAEAAFEGKKLGTIKGTVKSTGQETVKVPAIVVEKDGSIYTWALGKDGQYEMTLPVGEYELYAAALNHSPSEKKKVAIKEKGNADLNFEGLAEPGTVTFKVMDQDGQPLAARLAIEEGVEQPIVFLGPNTIFTEIKPKGEVVVPLAPGAYTFSATHAGYFMAPPIPVTITVEPGQPMTADVAIALEAQPRKRGFYNADLHHHSNLLDSDTPPEYLVRSQTAAGVDFTFISDHDTVANHHEIEKFSQEAGLQFIPGLEISPSWAHFNVYPLPLGKGLDLDANVTPIAETFKAARDLGARVIVVNHPTIEYGYFTARDRGTIPGGVFDESFDLMEINSLEKFEKDVPLYWEMWNQGKRKYLSGGTDNHNVWKTTSAVMRAFVKVDGELTMDKFIDSLLDGQSFISQGPLIYPETMFGSAIPAGKDATLKFEVESVMGLGKAVLIGNGEELQVLEFESAPKMAEVSFDVKAPEAGKWFSLVVYDKDGLRAWGNPVWVE
ncbi:phosphoesterase [Deltaproteobacteria bacterium Smac51]|nr:phosphoesterase [Deltaproteobacteria bacterium Smac51]